MTNKSSQMARTRLILRTAFLLPLAIIGAYLVFDALRGGIQLAISPYQDTYLPKLAEEKGWFEMAGVSVRTVELAWGDVIPSVAGASQPHVGITNLNTFLAAYEGNASLGRELVFFYPLFVFKGAAVLVMRDSGLASVEDLVADSELDRQAAVVEVANQLRGATIYATPNTEMEQVVLAGMKMAGLVRDVDYYLESLNPEDSLATFLSASGRNLAFSGGLTERTAAVRAGAKVLWEASDVLPPTIDGLVTTREFAESNYAELLTIVRVWFRTVQYIDSDINGRAPEYLSLLNTVAATSYTLDEFKEVWESMEVFFLDPDEVARDVLSSDGEFYWEAAWQEIEAFLVQDNGLAPSVPKAMFWGARVHKDLE